MSWHPNDLVTDADLRDYEAAILSGFGQTSWQAKRTKALEDWLFPILKANGFDPYRLRTRVALAKAFGYTAGSYTDRTAATQDGSADDLNLATTFATTGTDALFLASTQPFRGLFIRMLEAVSSAAGVLTVAYWNGAWTALSIADGTIQTATKTLSGSGAIGWLLPVDWQTRVVNGSDALYWVKVTVSAVPTSAKAGQIGAIRASSLRAPVTYRTLQLIMAEAPTGGDGPWAEKAAFYKGEADDALTRALQICGDEFDTDGSDLIDGAEPTQTVAEVTGGGAILERG